MSGLRVIILSGHPHAGEFGEVIPGSTMKGGGREVRLENCIHGVESCYVFPGQWRTDCERRR